MKLGEYLDKYLGGRDKVQCDYQPMMEMEIDGARLVTDKGRLFVVCGGDCIIQFLKSDRESARGTFYIVRDDTAGEQWGRQQNHDRIPESPRPSPILRLVWSL